MHDMFLDAAEVEQKARRAVRCAFVSTNSITQGEQVGVLWGWLFLAETVGWHTLAGAFIASLLLGLVGGMYPAYRATRMQPVEALRYE